MPERPYKNACDIYGNFYHKYCQPLPSSSFGMLENARFPGKIILIHAFI
ncbi:hypothetical protein H6G27_20545 [Nostoc linckia FACHB-104]|nr:hypothetical protein [Nostoc linckia FACHB-104]